MFLLRLKNLLRTRLPTPLLTTANPVSKFTEQIDNTLEETPSTGEAPPLPAVVEDEVQAEAPVVPTPPSPILRLTT